jgi:hypothetical protein
MALAAVIGCAAIGTIVSGAASMRTPAASQADVIAQLLPGWPTSPSASENETNRAVGDALKMLRSSPNSLLQREDMDRSRDALRAALSHTPHDAQLWLALAAIEVGRDSNGAAGSEPLKMAYFLAPNDARLMATRLEIATRMNGPIDMQLKLLAEGEVRLMLTRQPDQRAAVMSAYRRASNQGKVLLENAVRTTDPSVLSWLRG